MHIVSCTPFRKQQGNCMTVGVPAVTTNNYPSRNPYPRQGISALFKKYSYPLLCKQKKCNGYICTVGLGLTLTAES